MSAYKKILLAKRQRPTEVPGRTIVTESESDRGRILFSPAFRRLQQKAQVFSMEPNAAVRSRLTHSLEVSQIGRYISDEICAGLAKVQLIDAEERFALVNFVETACLMHDIGNPPFGHFGEAAIQNWFEEKGAKAIVAAVKLQRGTLDDCDPCLKEYLDDFYEFDGNPQGLRIVSRLQWNTDEYGLNLTSTTLAAYLKYLRRAGERVEGSFRKKAGFFSTEAPIINAVWSDFLYQSPQRFPLAYIMEAADDIAYCISDLEDSFEKNIISELPALQEIESNFLEQKISENDPCLEDITNALIWVRGRARPDGKEYTYTDFRTSLNRTIVRFVAQRYVDNHDAVLDGTLDTLLPVDSSCGAILDVLKAYCRENVYTADSIQRTELAGYTAISGLLDHCNPLLSCTYERFSSILNFKNKDSSGRPIVVESKLLRLFPERYIKAYKSYVDKEVQISTDEGKLKEWNARAHLCVDFISGMTDDFAMNTYRTLAGMRL